MSPIVSEQRVCYNSLMKDLPESIFTYHEQTKHSPHRYARSAGYLDRESEPNPFRRYEGSPLITLPLMPRDPDTAYEGLFDRSETKPSPFSVRSIAGMLELSLGLSAWKSYGGETWALRMNPSSGNLHPTEAYLVLPPLSGSGLAGGVFHYTPLLHGLERRSEFEQHFWTPVEKHFGMPVFFIGLSSIHWREAWKYGERAFRYSCHDTGHAMAALSFASSLFGWEVVYLNDLSSHDVAAVLGFASMKWHPFEKEETGPLLAVLGAGTRDVHQDLTPGLTEAFASLRWSGKPNRLSEKHREWSVIDEISVLTAKPRTAGQTRHAADSGLDGVPRAMRGADVIRQRRSALAYDKEATLPKDHFFGMLDRTMPACRRAPFDIGIGEASIHLLLFVHRIIGIEPGLYLLFREERNIDEIMNLCRTGFDWERMAEAPAELAFYRLRRGDYTSFASAASCRQDIAADGLFTVAMIAKFRETIEREPYRYRHLHWEAGMIGQALYLAAEAHGMRGTGMGCFFDDLVHELLGFSGNAYQDIYHFAVGKAAPDRRLATLPPYQHLPDLKARFDKRDAPS